MLEAIKNFPKQFSYNPKIENSKYYKKSKKFIILGMGGSHLAADLLQISNPELNLIIHKDYDLPILSKKELKNSLIIASSYSGNTEEVISGVKKAIKEKLNLFIISTGGKLLKIAKNNNIPYIQIPDTGIQPRSALGFNIRALSKAMKLNNILKETKLLSKKLNSNTYKLKGNNLAKKLKNYIPIIYSSTKNINIAYNWKIKFNENTKIPAFCNAIPELNHNEMNGFDYINSNKKLSNKFCFIFLNDKKDHKKNIKRMNILSKLYRNRKFNVINIDLSGKNITEKIFSNLLLADWTSYFLALEYKVDPEQVPMVEEFKKLIK